MPRPESKSFWIRRAASDEVKVLFDIWWRSASPDTWVLCEGAGQPIGFLMLKGSHVDPLFIAPEWIGRGAGGALLRHARSLRKRLTVDVNEQNVPALTFYRANGFVVSGRSDTDDEGRPFPLIHLTDS